MMSHDDLGSILMVRSSVPEALLDLNLHILRPGYPAPTELLQSARPQRATAQTTSPSLIVSYSYRSAWTTLPARSNRFSHGLM